MKNLVLVGLVHVDPRGYLRTLKLMKYFKPELVTIEGSPLPWKVLDYIKEVIEKYSCKYPLSTVFGIGHLMCIDAFFVPKVCEEMR